MKSNYIFRNERTNWTNKIYDVVLPERPGGYQIGKCYQLYKNSWVKPIKKYNKRFFRVIKGTERKHIEKMPSKFNYDEKRCYIY